jgi:hypothetical protein
MSLGNAKYPPLPPSPIPSPPPKMELCPAPFLGLTVQGRREPCSAVGFDFLIVRVIWIQKKSYLFQRLNLRQWIVPCSIFGTFESAARQRNKDHLHGLCWTEEHVESCCVVLCRTMQSRKTCTRRLDKHAPNRAWLGEGGVLIAKTANFSHQKSLLPTLRTRIVSPNTGCVHYWTMTNYIHPVKAEKFRDNWKIFKFKAVH